MLSSLAKNSWYGNFADFVNFNKKDKFSRSGLILLQSLALYFAIMYSWKLSCSK